jgi:hypothetical protein
MVLHEECAAVIVLDVFAENIMGGALIAVNPQIAPPVDAMTVLAEGCIRQMNAMCKPVRRPEPAETESKNEFAATRSMAHGFIIGAVDNVCGMESK